MLIIEPIQFFSSLKQSTQIPQLLSQYISLPLRKTIQIECCLMLRRFLVLSLLKLPLRLYSQIVKQSVENRILGSHECSPTYKPLYFKLPVGFSPISLILNTLQHFRDFPYQHTTKGRHIDKLGSIKTHHGKISECSGLFPIHRSSHRCGAILYQDSTHLFTFRCYCLYVAWQAVLVRGQHDAVGIYALQITGIERALFCFAIYDFLS